MFQFITLDLGPFCKSTELMTEYLTLMVSSPLQGFDTKGPRLETVGNCTGSEVLRITASAPVHCAVDADGLWLTKGSLSIQSFHSFQSHLKEAVCEVCSTENVYSQPEVTHPA